MRQESSLKELKHILLYKLKFPSSLQIQEEWVPFWWCNTGAILSLTRVLDRAWEFDQTIYILQTWKRYFTVSLGVFCWGCSRSKGCWAHYRPFSVIIAAQVWFIEPVVTQICFGWELDSGLPFVTDCVHNFHGQNFSEQLRDRGVLVWCPQGLHLSFCARLAPV